MSYFETAKNLMSVLVVGNDSFNIKNTVSLLRQEGYKVLTAHNGREALRTMGTRSVDLVLLDTSASRQDGYEINRRIERTFKASIIHLPGNDGFDNQFDGLGLGIDHRVVTALQAAELLTLVRAALQQRCSVKTKSLNQLSSNRVVEANPVLHSTMQLNNTFDSRAQPHTPKNQPRSMRQRSTSTVSYVSTLPALQFLLNSLINLHPSTAAWVYLGILAMAEICTFVVEPRLGLILHGITLMLLTLNAVLRWAQPVHYLLLSLIFVPLIRILSLTLFLTNISLIYWHFIITIPLLIAAIMMVRTLRLSWLEIGLNLGQPLPLQVLIALAGLIFGYLGYQILGSAPLISNLTWTQILGPALILLISTGFAEELIFRGIMQHASTKVMGSFGIFYTAALYANLHLGHRSPMNVLFAFGLALIFGWIVNRTRSLSGVTLCHGLTNIMLFLAMPFTS